MGLPSYLGWIPNNTTGIATPPGGKLAAGWLAAEKPPYQYMNWLFNLTSQWINRLGPQAYTVVVGSGANCTHATLAAAVADSGVGSNIKVVLTESATVASTIHLTKAGWKIEALPGVTYTKSGSAVSCFSCEADGVEIMRVRFAAWSTSGDKAITGTAAWTYGRVSFCNFNACDTDVDDSATVAGKNPITLSNFTEV